MAELSGLPLPRVAAFILEPQGEGFAALARRAGLKAGVMLAFRATLVAIKAQAGMPQDGLKLSLVQKVIDQCEQLDNPALARVQALLWRFAAEAAKAEAAQFAREAAASASAGRLPPLLDFSPVNDDKDNAPKLLADFSRVPVDAPPREFARVDESARTMRRASNCRPSASPGSTPRPKAQALALPLWRLRPSPAVLARSHSGAPRALGRGNTKTAAENEERHAAHPHRLGLFDLLAHQVGVPAVGEGFFHLIGVEPAFPGDFDQHLAVADVAPLDEIGLEQAIDDFPLSADRSCPANETVCVKRVG